MKNLITLLFVAVMSLAGSTSAFAQYSHFDTNRNYDNNHYSNRHNGNDFREVPANSEQVRQIINVLKQTSFDDKKLEIAKLCVSLRPMMMEDIASVAKLFSFDDRRLDFLEYAMENCPDAQRYTILERTFSFSSNYREFCRYMEKHYYSQNRGYSDNWRR